MEMLKHSVSRTSDRAHDSPLAVAKETKQITPCGTRDHGVKQVLAKAKSRFVISSGWCESQAQFMTQSECWDHWKCSRYSS